MKMGLREYNADDQSEVTLEQAQEAVGSAASLTLTGHIVDCGESPSGVWVKFKLDPRWGFAVDTFVMDLDPLVLPGQA